MRHETPEGIWGTTLCLYPPAQVLALHSRAGQGGGAAGAAGWNGLFPALLVHTAVQIHYLLSFQHVTILLSAGEVILVLLLEVAWWQVAGLMR